VHRFWWGQLKEIDQMEDVGVDGSIILEKTYRIRLTGHGMDASG
jgi:hypothetical protein